MSLQTNSWAFMANLIYKSGSCYLFGLTSLDWHSMSGNKCIYSELDYGFFWGGLLVYLLTYYRWKGCRTFDFSEEKWNVHRYMNISARRVGEVDIVIPDNIAYGTHQLALRCLFSGWVVWELGGERSAVTCHITNGLMKTGLVFTSEHEAGS